MPVPGCGTERGGWALSPHIRGLRVPVIFPSTCDHPSLHLWLALGPRPPFLGCAGGLNLSPLLTEEGKLLCSQLLLIFTFIC